MYRSSVSIRSILLLLALVFFPIAFADKIEDALHKRQSAPAGTGSSPSQTSAASSAPSPTSSAPPSSSPKPSASSPASSESPASPTSTPVVSVSVPGSAATSQQSVASKSAPSAISTPSVVVSEFTSSATRQIVTTIITTDNGVTMSQVLTTDALVAVATGTSTSTPGLGGSGGSSGSSGPNAQQKKIIIGVVVGIGGFVILGGMALVAWRVWGRKKQPSDFNDLHAPSPKLQPGPGGPSPFKSTLDQYHNPGTVNTASNF
ncbi:hypothetical protein GP486_000655 [Trichoglossum hirsutum]|uniref:Mid2 domain-containing protein n=1 Tax=Trichoglossum hirsutum TaxID=265104 RepID=A0A9P8LIA3_9PEZI|nr:hypothetical protein GP486_000655 [Trichoglossum hirsutum]